VQIPILWASLLAWRADDEIAGAIIRSRRPSTDRSTRTIRMAILDRDERLRYGRPDRPRSWNRRRTVGELEDPPNIGVPPTARCCGAAGIVRRTACACAHRRQGASLRSAPRFAGLPALTPAPRTLVQTGSCWRCPLIQPLHVVVVLPPRIDPFPSARWQCMALRSLDPAPSRSIALIASATLASGGQAERLGEWSRERSHHAALLDLGDRQSASPWPKRSTARWCVAIPDPVRSSGADRGGCRSVWRRSQPFRADLL